MLNLSKRGKVVIWTFGLAVTVAMMISASWAIITKYFESREVRAQIQVLNPQTKEEYFDCLDSAMAIRSAHPSPFSPLNEEIVDLLTQSQRRSWADADFINRSIRMMNEWIRQGTTYSFRYEWDPGMNEANYYLSHWPVFVAKLASKAIAGLGVTSLIPLFWPYLVILLVSYGLISSRQTQWLTRQNSQTDATVISCVKISPNTCQLQCPDSQPALPSSAPRLIFAQTTDWAIISMRTLRRHQTESGIRNRAPPGE